MNTDKIVTYADLPTLRSMRYGESTPADDGDALLDRLIAAAEADAPPLPEGWVLLDMPTKCSQRILWHEAGCLYVGPNGHEHLGDVDAFDRRDHLTPLRPTVTEADVERAAYAIFRERDGIRYEGCTRDAFLSDARAAFAAAGIEVTP